MNQNLIRPRLNWSHILALALSISFLGYAANAAELEVIADTPTSFRANFVGADTDPATQGGGNDYQEFKFNFWTVLVNLRGDLVDLNGDAWGFYEIKLTHTGASSENESAPVVSSSLSWGPLAAEDVLGSYQVQSGLNGAGSDYLTTDVSISYDPETNVVNYSGSIAGDSDLNGDGVMDSQQTDYVAKTLQDLKSGGAITGKDMGQILKQTIKLAK